MQSLNAGGVAVDAMVATFGERGTRSLHPPRKGKAQDALVVSPRRGRALADTPAMQMGVG